MTDERVRKGVSSDVLKNVVSHHCELKGIMKGDRMISTLYTPFRHWSDGGSIYILSDLHFDDTDCKIMDPNWVTPEKQVEIINRIVFKSDTFVCLGDVGNPKYVSMIRAGKKILLLGNHDARGAYKGLFDEIYSGPLFVSDKILLSHEPVYGLSWCLNIHGHDHNGVETYQVGCKHINLAANLCGYTPISLGKIIKDGILSDIDSIHRQTIDKAVEKKKDNNVDRIVREFSKIYEMAYETYNPVVTDLCSRYAPEDEVEYVLDRMLDFCGEKNMLRLFKQICRKYYEIYPEMIASEINSYREIYDSDNFETSR